MHVMSFLCLCELDEKWLIAGEIHVEHLTLAYQAIIEAFFGLDSLLSTSSSHARWRSIGGVICRAIDSLIQSKVASARAEHQ
jgi:hypothetical protein